MSRRSPRIASYPVRMMASVAGSLLLVVGVVHLPLERPHGTVGWQLDAEPHPFRIDLTEIRSAAVAPLGAPITTFAQASEPEPSQEAEDPGDADLIPSPTLPKLERLEARSAILEFSEQLPEIVGGMGAYYLKIEYPRAAIEAGIHGRLILSFVVEEDGRASHVEVLQSLHALCDSAAVQALRGTHFVPGRQNGEAVRVRMRLPVLFKLIEPPDIPPSED